MRVEVLYFAAVRERVGSESEAVELPEGATVGELLDHLGQRRAALLALRPHLQVARNRAIARADDVLADGDEVALIPPVAGGSAPGVLAAVRDQPLSLDEVVAAVADEGAGAVVTFAGAVRRISRGRTVDHLEYEAYAAMAGERMAAIAEETAATHGARVAILHRVGRLAVGEIAVVIAASAPHRAEAFAACREAIERLKNEAPIWKKEVGEDGESWVGLGP